MIKQYLIAFLILLITMPNILLAIGDDVIVTQQVGFDTTPPTVPSSLTATPVSQTQINLAWSTSTDADSAVSGYQVFRDSVQIATTSQTSYVDSGLTASTTYAYNVTAFDIFSNISARSATTSTTTNAIPEPPVVVPVEIESRKTTTHVVINGIQVETTDTTAEIVVATNVYTIAAVRFGSSEQYEKGSLASDIYRKEHRLKLSSLEPERRYYFEVTVQDQRGETAVYRDSFITRSEIDIIPPENVSNLTSVINGGDVSLSWNNPKTDDFSKVRIIANDTFFPIDFADGRVVYEGNAETFQDTNVHPAHDEMYYTVFALDDNGNQSSGAITYVSWNEDTRLTPTAITSRLEEGASSTDRSLDPQYNSLTFNNLEFIQNAKIRKGYQSLINLDPSQPFTVRLAYEMVPEHLKTITVTLTDPENPTLQFAFLLRINHTKTHYEATVGALKRAAEFPLTFTFFDFKTKEIVHFTGTLSTVSHSEHTYAEPKREFLEHMLRSLYQFWWFWLLLLLLLLVAYRLLKD